MSSLSKAVMLKNLKNPNNPIKHVTQKVITNVATENIEKGYLRQSPTYILSKNIFEGK
jgi:hypothetical protein